MKSRKQSTQPLALSLLPWLALPTVAVARAPQAADLVVRGGKIVTLEEEPAVVGALAIRDGLIVALGEDAEGEELVGPNTEVLELEGRLATPGLIEGHGHFLGIGDAALQLDLSRARDWEQIVAEVAAAVRRTPPGILIRGRGWHRRSGSTHPPAASLVYPPTTP